MRHLFTVAFLLVAGAAYAQDAEQKDDGYPFEFERVFDVRRPHVINRDNLTHESLLPGQLLRMGLHELVDAMPEDEAKARLLVCAAGSIGLSFFDHAMLVAGHENGHGVIWSRLGFDESVLTDRTNGESFGIHGTFETYPRVLRRSVFDPGNDWSTSLSANDWARFYANPQYVAHEHEIFAMIEAGGLNQEQHTLEYLADRVIGGKGHAFDLFPYFRSAIATYGYQRDGGDIVDYVDELAYLGVKTTKSRVENASLVRFASGSAIAMLLAGYDALRTGDLRADPLRWEFVDGVHVYWPEFSSYLTLEGVTVKARVPLSALNEAGYGIQTDISYERSIDTGCQEFGLHERYTTPFFLGTTLSQYYKGFYNTDDGGYWVEVGGALSPCKGFSIGAAYYRGSGYTFERELDGPTLSCLDERVQGLEITASVNIEF